MSPLKHLPDDMNAITLRNQLESPLLRLPGEICNKIYGYVFHVDCIDFSPRYLRPYPPLDCDEKLCAVYDEAASPALQSLFMLLESRSVCRQYHAETNLLLFKSNTIRGCPLEVPRLVDRMPKDVRDAMTAIRLYSYPSAFASYRHTYNSLSPLTLFPNLRKLELQIIRAAWMPCLTRINFPCLVAAAMDHHITKDIEIAILGTMIRTLSVDKNDPWKIWRILSRSTLGGKSLYSVSS